MKQTLVVVSVLLAAALTGNLGLRGQERPLTQAQVQGMVRSGLGDESGAKLIAQRGIDFVPSQDFLESLKTAGASQAFLQALRAAKPPQSTASSKEPLNQVQIFALLTGQVPSHRVAMLVRERGINFKPTDEYLEEVRLAGGDGELITALKTAPITKLPGTDPTLDARQAEIRDHVARGVQFANKGQYAEAEQEYTAALKLDPENDSLYVSLARVFVQQKKWDDAKAAAREAIRLNPNNDRAHNNLGTALENKGDLDGGLAEYREALRLNPNNDYAHANLGCLEGRKGDLDGDMAEQHEALRLNSKNERAHLCLGDALRQKGDLNGAMVEVTEAIRLQPDIAASHAVLAGVFFGKRDIDGAIQESREAVRLDPSMPETHLLLAQLLMAKGDRQGAVEQCRIAQENGPNNTQVQNGCKQLAGLTPGQPSQPPANVAPGGALFVAFRTSRHQRYSTPEVFGEIADQVELYLKSQNVALMNDAMGKTIRTESEPSVYDLVNQIRTGGGGSLILLTVDRPLRYWVKLQVQCYDASGHLLWEETTADTGSGHMGTTGVRNAVQKMEERLSPHMGQAGMLTK